MLGEAVGEAAGKLTGLRVLPDGRVEASFQGSGKLLGAEISDIGTYWQEMKPGGVLYAEGQVLLMTREGEASKWTGFGVGKPTGQGTGARWAVCGSFRGEASPKFARLNSVSTVIEFENDESGNYHWKLWEWKPKS